MGRPAILAAAAGVLAAAAPLHAGSPASPGATHLGCGDLAPMSNQCFDLEAVAYEPHHIVSWAFLGYVGRIDVTLEQRIEWLELTLRKTWTCEFLGVGLPPELSGAVALECAGPFYAPPWVPELIPGWDTTLRCRTWPAELPGALEAGPAGPWGCTVTFEGPVSRP